MCGGGWAVDFGDDEMSEPEMKEADITISGVTLTTAQSLALRVAVESALLWLATEGTEEALGPIGPAYRRQWLEIRRLIGMTAK